MMPRQQSAAESTEGGMVDEGVASAGRLGDRSAATFSVNDLWLAGCDDF